MLSVLQLLLMLLMLMLMLMLMLIIAPFSIVIEALGR
jgi:hypothetical protein